MLDLSEVAAVSSKRIKDWCCRCRSRVGVLEGRREKRVWWPEVEKEIGQEKGAAKGRGSVELMG